MRKYNRKNRKLKKTETVNKSNRKFYTEYLQSDEWQLKRLQKAKEQHYTCENCGKVVRYGFHIHHKTYKNLGNEPLSDLMFLCESCHKELHIALSAKRNNERKKEEENKKVCANCFFSQCMQYRGTTAKTVLWCNLKCCECKGNICSKYRKGELKVIEQLKKRKNKKIRE